MTRHAIMEIFRGGSGGEISVNFIFCFRGETAQINANFIVALNFFLQAMKIKCLIFSLYI